MSKELESIKVQLRQAADDAHEFNELLLSCASVDTVNAFASSRTVPFVYVRTEIWESYKDWFERANPGVELVLLKAPLFEPGAFLSPHDWEQGVGCRCAGVRAVVAKGRGSIQSIQINTEIPD